MRHFKIGAFGLAILLLAGAGARAAINDTLDDNRNRLIADGAARRGLTVDQYWNSLDAAAKGAFLMNTHRLSLYYVMDSRVYMTTMLDNIDGLYSIEGGTSCGGDSNNRVFFKMSPILWDNMVWQFNEPLEYGIRFRDINMNQGINHNSDLGGAHPPFNASNETSYGDPRGQMHFWWDYMSGQNTCVWRNSLGCIIDYLVMEMDHDFNAMHDSSTECIYTREVCGNIPLTGRQVYECQHPAGPDVLPVDWSWVPRVNWATAGTAVASSESYGYAAAGVIDRNVKCREWNNGPNCGWMDSSTDFSNDWVQVTLPGVKPIKEITVYSLQDDYMNAVNPTGKSLTFTLYGVQSFVVEYRPSKSSTTWSTFPGGNVIDNNRVWVSIRNTTATNVYAYRIRVTAAAGGRSRIVETRAYQ